ncbi:MAG TPA: GAF domain-containing protein [Kiloniellales bacterium]|nr:GAF domain-containing protein [Kiloniellales bacterium]
MADQARSDLAPLHELAQAAGLPGQPEALCRAAERVLQARFGHQLFTLLSFHPESGDVERLYSSRPDAYPLAGRKKMGPTPWGDQVLHQGKPYLGRTFDDIRWAFPDHELITSLRLGCILNRPLAWNGKVMGVLSLLKEGERGYDEADLKAAAPYAALLLPVLLASG